MSAQRIVTWDEYCEMSEQDQQYVTVVTFTGLADCATLEELARFKKESTLGSGGRGNSAGPRSGSD